MGDDLLGPQPREARQGGVSRPSEPSQMFMCSRSGYLRRLLETSDCGYSRSIDLLGEFPPSGRASAAEGVRELPIVRDPDIVFYSVDAVAQDVIVLRARHTSQAPDPHARGT